MGEVQEGEKPGDTENIRKAKIQYFEELSEQSKGNPKKAWREVNRLLGNTCNHGINSIRTDSRADRDRILLTSLAGISHQ